MNLTKRKCSEIKINNEKLKYLDTVTYNINT